MAAAVGTTLAGVAIAAAIGWLFIRAIDEHETRRIERENERELDAWYPKQ